MVEFFNVIQLCLVEMVDEVDVPHFAKIHQNNGTPPTFPRKCSKDVFFFHSHARLQEGTWDETV